MAVKVLEKYSFINAFNSLSLSDRVKVKNEIVAATGCGLTKWFSLKRGYNHKNEDTSRRSISELSIIQEIFAKYGIPDCWD